MWNLAHFSENKVVFYTNNTPKQTNTFFLLPVSAFI